MTLVLDTHALIWYASESPNLSATAAKEIAKADTLLVSPISAWEIGMLVSKGRLSLRFDVTVWLEYTSQRPKVKWVDLSPTVAVEASRLPGVFHGDPADRIITATAISFGAPIVTLDRRIQAYSHVKTIW